MEAIGLKAILDDADFQRGLSNYTSGIGKAQSLTDKAAAAISGSFKLATATVTAAFAGMVAAAKVGLDATLQWSENMDQLGDMFGMSGEQASAWTYAMNKVGLSLDEGAQGLNFFTRGLDDLKNATPSTTVSVKDNSKAVEGLNRQLADAQTRLARAQQTLAEAKKPTNAMRWAVEDAQKAVARLNEKLGETPGTITKVGTATPKLSPFGEALKKLGVNAYDAKGKLKDFDTIMPEIMDQFQKLPAGVNASALAMDLFGARGGSKFLDFLRQGGAGLKDATVMVKALGLDMSTDEVNAAEEFGFAINQLNLGLLGIKNSIGREVLPIARKLVDWLNRDVIPRIVKLTQEYAPRLIRAVTHIGEIIGDLLGGKWYAVWELRSFFEKLFGYQTTSKIFNLIDVLGKVKDVVGRLWKAFQQGGAGGLFNQLVTEIQRAAPAIQAQLATWGSQFWNWLTGPNGALSQAGAKIGEFAGKLGGFVKANWPLVSAQFSSWATGFWDWLTGKGGALSQVGAKIYEIAKPIASWLQTNWDTTIQPAILSWAAQFWNWITDPSSGVIVTIAANMEQLTKNIRDWATAPDTQKELNKIGEEIARGIINGIGDLFRQDSEGKSLIETLINTLYRAIRNLYESIMELGRGIAVGILNGFMEKLNVDQTLQQAVVNTFNAFWSRVITALEDPAGPLMGYIKQMVDWWWGIFSNAINGLMGGLSAQGTASGAAGGAAGWAGQAYANGGPVRQTGLALVHRGEYVIPARQTSNINNSRTIAPGAVAITIQGGTSLSPSAIEAAVYRGIEKVMNAA